MLRAILKKVKGCPFSEQALNLMISEVADFFNVSKGKVMSVCRAVVTGNKVSKEGAFRVKRNVSNTDLC